MGNKWWKFQKDILNGFGVIDHFVQIDCSLWPASVMEQAKLTGAGHMHAVNLNKMNYNSKTVQDIFLKFSPFVTHKSVVNWWKNFGRHTTDLSATPLFVSKLRKGIAPILFEIFSKNFFWWGSRSISVTQWQEFQISSKKGRFEMWGMAAPSRGNWVIHA